MSCQCFDCTTFESVTVVPARRRPRARRWWSKFWNEPIMGSPRNQLWGEQPDIQDLTIRYPQGRVRTRRWGALPLRK